MARQLTTLPIDCLYEISEYLEKDIPTIHSCLLANHLLCEIFVRILWRDINNIVDNIYHTSKSSSVRLSFFNTLIACLPNESKEHLYKNEIFIPTPSLKSPFFNYATFCKVLSIPGIKSIVYDSLKILSIQYSLHVPLNYLVINEIVKMFVNQASLKVFTYYNQVNNFNNLSFPCFPGMRNLSKLYCDSNLPSDFCYQLSQTCHNIQSISILFNDNNNASNELKKLIFLQNNLKSLTLRVCNYTGWVNIIPTLTKHSNIMNILTRLHLYCNSDYVDIPFSFIELFKNLQEVIFSFFSSDFRPYINVRDFEKLQYVNFPKLQILKIPYQCPKPEYLMKFLEINGKKLNKLYISEGISKPILKSDLNNDLNLSIANFCLNLKKLIIRINDDEIDMLKSIFISCQYLKFIKILCEAKCMSETILEIVANYSPKDFCELTLYNSKLDFIHPKNLESFFISWKNRKSVKLLIMISNEAIDEYYEVYNNEYYKNIVYDIINNCKHEKNDGDYENYENEYIDYKNYEDCCDFIYHQNMEIIEKYENLGIIRFKSKVVYIKEEEIEFE
ncbi:hypothetical protein RhiirA4_548059 [Rhizophagus irregularis]|uniref:F-box domain-containing protein n=1 Tax=Rhizophagus irregularis TaxID=588596 RepID=A0A2I1H5I9_9GLOM|nr:hypothetical protein RhiirA4_548059 [Rhizophagus irregularis]